MKKEIFYSDQPILTDDLDRAQSTKEAAIKERAVDSFTPGILKDSQFFVETVPFQITVISLPYSVNVGTGIAYDPTGERIIINSTSTYNAAFPTTTTDNGIGGTTLTPRSTGTNGVPLTSGQVNYIYVTYLQTIDPAVFTLQEDTNARLFTKADDGYRIDVVADPGPAVGNPVTFQPNPNAIFIGAVDIAQTVNLTSLVYHTITKDQVLAVVPPIGQSLSDLSKPYIRGQSVSFDDHVHAVGSGTPSPKNPHGMTAADLTGFNVGETVQQHQQFFHESGISGDPLSITSSLYGTYVSNFGAPIPPTFARDNFLIKALTAPEAVLIDGIFIDSTIITEDVLFYFNDASGNFLDNGTYTIYYDAVSKSLKLAANFSPVNTAYQTKGVTSLTVTALNVLGIAAVTSVPTNFLLWQVTWSQSGPNPGPGNDNFPSIIDLRIFGTIDGKSLAHDSATDTVTISHNVTINKGFSVLGSPVFLTVLGNSLEANLVTRTDAVSPTNKVNILADVLAVQGIILDSISISAQSNLLSPGPGGLDAGVLSSSTWYAIYVITNDLGTTISGLLSTSLTPTLVNCPGYTKFRRVGWVYNNASANFVQFFRDGDWIFYVDASMPTFLSPTGTTSFATAMPATSRLIKFSISISGPGDGANMSMKTTGSSMPIIPVLGQANVVGGVAYSDTGHVEFATNTSQQIDITFPHTSTLYVLAYHDPV